VYFFLYQMQVALSVGLSIKGKEMFEDIKMSKV